MQILKVAPRKTNAFLNEVVEFLSKGQVVDRGKVTKVSNLDVLHGIRLPKGCYRVAMTQVYGGKDADLSHPPPMEDDVRNLSATIKTTIAWPKKDLLCDYYFVFTMVQQMLNANTNH